MFVPSSRGLKKDHKFIFPDHNLLHNTSKKGKGGCDSDRIQVNLYPTYDVCLDISLYIVDAYRLPFYVNSILLSSIHVFLGGFKHWLFLSFFLTDLVFIQQICLHLTGINNFCDIY